MWKQTNTSFIKFTKLKFYKYHDIATHDCISGTIRPWKLKSGLNAHLVSSTYAKYGFYTSSSKESTEGSFLTRQKNDHDLATLENNIFTR